MPASPLTYLHASLDQLPDLVEEALIEVQSCTRLWQVVAIDAAHCAQAERQGQQCHQRNVSHASQIRQLISLFSGFVFLALRFFFCVFFLLLFAFFPVFYTIFLAGSLNICWSCLYMLSWQQQLDGLWANTHTHANTRINIKARTPLRHTHTHNTYAFRFHCARMRHSAAQWAAGQRNSCELHVQRWTLCLATLCHAHIRLCVLKSCLSIFQSYPE